MKKIIYTLFIWMLLPVLTFAQVGAPNKYLVKYKAAYTAASGSYPVNYSLQLYAMNASNTIIKTFHNQVVNAYNPAKISGVGYVDQVIGTLAAYTTAQSVGCIISSMGSNKINPNVNIRAGLSWVDNRSQIENDPLCPMVENYHPDVEYRVLPVIMIANADRTDEAQNIYCEDGVINLKLAYHGTGETNVYWQYRLNGTGDYTMLSGGASNTRSIRITDLFGSNYSAYLNTRIEFRAVAIANYPDGTAVVEADEGSNPLAYYFVGKAPEPTSVQAIQPSCSGEAATGMVIKFDRALKAGEIITQLYLTRVQDGTSILHAAKDAGITPAADNSFTWTGISPMVKGTYNLQVSATINGQDECNQTIYTFDVDPPEAVTFSVSGKTAVNCFGGNDGTITLAGKGGTGTYNYSSNNGSTWQTSNVLTGLSKGNYQLLVKDGNGCISTNAITEEVTQPAAALATSVSTYKDPLGATTNDGYINITVSNGTPGYTYTWSNGATTQNLTGVGGGTFTVTVKDKNGCTATTGTSLLAPDPINITITETAISCNGMTDGALQAGITGGVKPYAISWSNGVADTYTSQLGQGNYTFSVRDANGITASRTYNLVQPGVLTIALTPTATSCFGVSDGQVSALATGGTSPYTYATGPTVTGLPAGPYSIRVTDRHGCAATGTATVTSPDLLTISSDITTPTRFGSADGSIVTSGVGGNGSYTYRWNTGSTSNTITNLADGTYTVEVTDLKGCKATGEYNVLQPDPLTMTVQLIDTVLCHGLSTGKVQAVVAGGVKPYTYTWSNGLTTEDISSLPIGTYSVVVKDKSDVVINGSYTITEPALLQLSLTASEVSCSGENDATIISTTSGGVQPYAYSWSTGATTPDLSGLDGGMYTLHLTDANRCALSSSATVVAPNALSMDAAVAQPICNGDANGSIVLMTTGGRQPYTYSWSTGANEDNLGNLKAGTYTVRMTDFSGCIMNKTYTLAEPASLTVDLGRDRTLCVGQSLSLDGSIANGVNYSWTSDNGFTATTPTVVVNETGNYNILSTDNKGCTATDDVQVISDATEISADFLMSTEAYTNESVIAVNVSSPKADRITWSLPEGATITSQNDTLVELTFSHAGHYVISMTTYRGDCEATAQKDVMVVAGVTLPDVTTQHNSLFKQAIVRPNPNNGQFYADVEAAEDITVSYRLLDIQRNRVVAETKGQLLKDVVTAVPFNFAGQPAGVYVLLIESVKEKKALKVLIL